MQLKWQKEPPDSEGDWLWVKMWGCGCCVCRSGIAFCRLEDNEYKISWEGSDQDGWITAWAKIDLPASGFEDEFEELIDVRNLPKL